MCAPQQIISRKRKRNVSKNGSCTSGDTEGVGLLLLLVDLRSQRSAAAARWVRNKLMNSNLRLKKMIEPTTPSGELARSRAVLELLSSISRRPAVCERSLGRDHGKNLCEGNLDRSGAEFWARQLYCQSSWPPAQISVGIFRSSSESLIDWSQNQTVCLHVRIVITFHWSKTCQIPSRTVHVRLVVSL